MWNQYPPPSYAAHTWTQGQRLFLAMPGLDPEASGHKVAVEIDQAALRGLLARSVSLDYIGDPAKPRLSLSERKSIAALCSILGTLSAREADGRHTISTPGAPSQYDLDIVLRALKDGRVTKVANKKIPKELNIEDIGELV